MALDIIICLAFRKDIRISDTTLVSDHFIINDGILRKTPRKSSGIIAVENRITRLYLIGCRLEWYL